MRTMILAFLVFMTGCAAKAALEDTVTEIGRTAAQANAGIAALSTSTQELLGTLNGEIAASGSETRALMVETRALLVETKALLATARAEVASNGSATVVLAGSLSGLADTLREGIAANSSSTRATTAAIASTTQEFNGLLSELRPNLVAASAEIAPTLANVREATKKVSERADDPLISNESRWLIRIMLGAVAVLLVHAVWTHLHLRKVASDVLAAPETEPEPPEES